MSANGLVTLLYVGGRPLHQTHPTDAMPTLLIKNARLVATFDHTDPIKIQRNPECLGFLCVTA